MTTARTFVVQVFSWALLLTVIAAGTALIVVPKATGARPLTVLSGSMTGTHDVGDVVVVRPVDPADLKIGDVITFQPISDDPSLTTHRIIAIQVGSEGRQFVTQGDANNAADLAPLRPAQVKGEVWYAVPKVGYVSVWMAGGWLRTVTDLAAIGLLLYGAVAIMSGLVGRRRRAASTDDVAAETVETLEKVEVSA
jgi:signal peptidase